MNDSTRAIAVKASGAAPRRRPVPMAALVGFWLIVILLLATGLAVAANYGASSAVAKDAAAPYPAARAAVAAATRLPARTPSTQGRGSGVLLAPTVAQAGPAATPGAPAETPTPTPTDLPPAVLLDGVPVGKQTRSLNCEFQTASDLAWYYGQPFTWEEIYQYVGHEPGGNPHKGFVGRSFDDKPGQLFPQGYGVYAEPIAAALEQLGLPAEAVYDRSDEWLRKQLAAGRPVMVWATAGLTVRPVATWTAVGGVVVKGVPGEHTYLLIGYDGQGVWLIDPYDGERHHFKWAAFVASWDLLDRMAVVVMEAPGSR